MNLVKLIEDLGRCPLWVPVACLVAVAMLAAFVALQGGAQEPETEGAAMGEESTATEVVRQAWQEGHGLMLRPGQFVEVEILKGKGSGITSIDKVLLDLSTGVLYLRCVSQGFDNGSVTPYLDSNGEVQVLEGDELEAWRQAAMEDGTWDPDWTRDDAKEGGRE